MNIINIIITEIKFDQPTVAESLYVRAGVQLIINFPTVKKVLRYNNIIHGYVLRI